MKVRDDISRFFDRQIKLAEIGRTGQQKLCDASVLVIGAGGLGCPALQYLAAGGIGRLGVVDFDTVEESNLHRQTLYTLQDVGMHKSMAAAQKIEAMYPWTSCTAYDRKLDNKLALKIFPEYDIVLDGTDSIATRYLINDACRILGKPWVYGSVNGFGGQWAIFDTGHAQYRDVFPTPPDEDSVATCDTLGTIGPVPGMVGTLQALECMKWVLGISKPGFLHTFDALQNDFYSIEIMPGEHADQPESEESFLNFSYTEFCNPVPEISVQELFALVEEKPILIVDVRDEEEMPVCKLKGTIHVPLRLVDAAEIPIPESGIVVTLCQSGQRSKIAAEKLMHKYPDKRIVSLRGGMNAMVAMQEAKN